MARIDQDVWTGHPALIIAEAAERAGMTDRELLGKIRAARCPDPPPTQAGQSRTWAIGVVASLRQHVRREAARPEATATPVPPAPPATGPDGYDHQDSLRRIMAAQHARVAAMSPALAARWLRSPDGRAEVRQLIHLQILSGGLTALEDRAGANSAKLVDSLAKLAQLSEPDEDTHVEPGALADDAQAAAYEILDMLQACVAVVGLDAVLAAIGRREHHLTPLASA